MRILVTGGYGFLGGRIAQYLHQKGHQIVLASRNESEPPKWLPQAEVVKIEWSDESALEEICNGADVVIQAAGMNTQECYNNPAKALEFNGLATAHLLAASTRASVKRFLYLSTAHVYSDSLTGIITEDTCPRNLHPYATSHLVAENLIRYAHLHNQIEGIVVRLSNVFGAPAHKNANCWMLLINDICKQAVTTKKIVLYTSGSQRRDFVSLLNVNKAIDCLLQIPQQKIDKGVFNIGGEWAPTVFEVACIIQKRCKESLGFKPDIVRPLQNNNAIVGEFDYHIDMLNKVGFRAKNDRTEEIDGLLEFCVAEFT